MGRVRAFCLLVLMGCRTAAPPRPARPPPAPYDWRHDGMLTLDEGRGRCAQTLPQCQRVFAAWVAPQSPCHNRGMRCTEQLMPRGGHWVCGCNQCTSENDCGAGEFCSYGSDPCEQTEPARCAPGKLVLQPCVPQPRPP